MQGAARVDEQLGIRHEAEFVGPPGERVFCTRFVPLEPPLAGVVVCSPILAEFPKNYRREVLLARELAQRGLAVQRFHYRGAGHSDGESADLTYSTMWVDTRMATESLVEATGVSEVSFLGTRLGALVAARAAAGHPGAPLVLWEPVLEPSAYLREVLRARLMSELRQGLAQPSTTESLLGEMSDTGTVDVLGYALERQLFDSLEGHDLATELGEEPRSLLLVELGTRPQLRPQYAALELRLRRRGWAVDSGVVGAEEEAWWFINDPWKTDDVVAKSTPLLELTASWLANHVSSPVAS